MTSIEFRSTMNVQLIDSMASDLRVIRAAQVSTKGTDAEETEMSAQGQYKFIDFLLKNRHGSPFEHCEFTFLVTAPIFVWREIMRHRIASYNEESGRYKKLEPVFYIPDDDRKLVQVGKPGEYKFESGTIEQLDYVQQGHMYVSRVAYDNYERLLELGIAREVARMSLPLNIYSSAYVTMNARALMNFLSLRVVDELHSYFPSYAQEEIQMVARSMEEHFRDQMPLTAAIFHDSGRVAP